jgi:hypothetical protein
MKGRDPSALIAGTATLIRRAVRRPARPAAMAFAVKV